MADQIEAKAKEGIFAELKIDFPALLALNIFITFAAVVLLSLFIKIPIDGPAGQLLEVLKNVVLIMVGFYFGSAISNRRKDEAIIGQMAPAKNPPNVPDVTPVVAWWSLLTDTERNAIQSAVPNNPQLAAIMTAMQAGKGTKADLEYLVTRGMLSPDRADVIGAA